VVQRSLGLTSKLKQSDPELKNYVFELEKENLRLQRQIAKLQVKDVSQQNQINALKKAQPKMIVRLTNYATADKKIKKKE
jgi:hypothetical protein